MTTGHRTVTFEQVADFILTAANVDRSELRPDTRLLEDLGLDGDDADELMIQYAERFDVDMSEYNFLDYFGWEGDIVVWGFWLHLWCLMSSRARKRLADGESWFAPVTVLHLVRCANDGVWHHPFTLSPEDRLQQKHTVRRHLAAVLWRVPFIAMLLVFALVPPMVAIVRPAFPTGLFLLGLGGMFIYLLVSGVSPARHYYQHRAERGGWRAKL